MTSPCRFLTLLFGACALVLGASAGTASAQASAHYVPGVEGIMGASLPPPGLYLRDYNQFYTANRVNDNGGHKVAAAAFNSCVYAQVPRVLYITDQQILGGNLGVDALFPFVYQHVKANTPAGRFDDSSFGVGDPFAEVSLSWHFKQLDLSLAAGEWFPIGNFAAPPTTEPGLGYWTTMFTVGGTWYIDQDKTWTLSVLNRFEINSEQKSTEITPGDAYTVEAAVGKALSKSVVVGITGYYQAQVTRDQAWNATTAMDAVAAVGPEIIVNIPKPAIALSLRWDYEFWAVNRAQGNSVVLTATYRF